ncbi:MAG TPA: hypothetical protein VMW05_09345 [Methyloceanibacter sp.]|nr:hypothetical protein [Methyloceanibacter sp.]
MHVLMVVDATELERADPKRMRGDEIRRLLLAPEPAFGANIVRLLEGGALSYDLRHFRNALGRRQDTDGAHAGKHHRDDQFDALTVGGRGEEDEAAVDKQRDHKIEPGTARHAE